MHPMLDPVFTLSPRIRLLPVVHASGDFAVALRRVMLEHEYDCLAVPLPRSFQAEVERAIEDLPVPSVVVQTTDSWRGFEAAASERQLATYVPIDPCQPIIAALRTAMGEHKPRVFIDQESEDYPPHTGAMPDPYALRRVAWERFAATILPGIQRPEGSAITLRLRWMGRRLKELEHRYRAILAPCGMLDWPWIREAYHAAGTGVTETAEEMPLNPPRRCAVFPASLAFLFGEIPYITGLYERARAELDDDHNLSVDGVKQLLLAAREKYREDFRHRARPITPQALAVCLKYMRNLSLLDRRLTPDLYTMVTVAKQVVSDAFAIHVAEQAREYPWTSAPTNLPIATPGIGKFRLEDKVFAADNRLPGIPLIWRPLELQRRPDQEQLKSWQTRWNPYRQCSWPPEDQRIEGLRTRVVDHAKRILGANLARHEKFTTSIKDGIDLRETLRNWHTGEIYVKENPPDRGNLDAVVMLFDVPADPRNYPWRTTWFAEHDQESTLAFFASDFRAEMVGPGIGVGTYGGALFLFPPIVIPDIWEDPRLDFTETLEERVLAAACLHSRGPHVALASSLPPGPGWRRMARRFRKKWVHVPLGGFGASTIEQLRTVHVLNGRQVRDFAARFIRKA